MNKRYQGFYPTTADFGFRMLSCVWAVVGTLSEKEFTGLFAFPSAKRVMARFKRAVFRAYVKMNMNPPNLQRLKDLPFGVKRRYIAMARAALCNIGIITTGRLTPYALYRETIRKGLDREAFDFWWQGLLDWERLVFLDACVEKLEESSYNLWLNGVGEDARICVQMAGGTESGPPRIF